MNIAGKAVRQVKLPAAPPAQGFGATRATGYFRRRGTAKHRYGATTTGEGE